MSYVQPVHPSDKERVAFLHSLKVRQPPPRPVSLRAACFPLRRRFLIVSLLQIINTEKEAAFDRITHAARKAFNTPLASVNFIERDRVWLKSCDGFDYCEMSRYVHEHKESDFSLLQTCRKPASHQKPASHHTRVTRPWENTTNSCLPHR
jgi:hypothetical protein